MHERAHTLLRGAAAAAAANLAKAGSWGSGTACVTWNLYRRPKALSSQ